MDHTGNDKNAFPAESKLKALKKTKIYQEIAKQIYNLIEEGKLKYGDQLPPERRLSEIFQVSRHSVREAIRALEQQNILKSRVGSGTFVVVDDGPSVDDLLTKAIHRRKDKLAEIFQFRKMLEPQIAAQAALNATAKDIVRLEQILERQRRSTGDLRLMVELDDAFHIALAEMTHNSVLLKVVERLNDILAGSRVEGSQSRERLEHSIEGHSKVIKALAEKNAAAAMSAMEEHLTQVQKIAMKRHGSH